MTDGDFATVAVALDRLEQRMIAGQSEVGTDPIRIAFAVKRVHDFRRDLETIRRDDSADTPMARIIRELNDAGVGL